MNALEITRPHELSVWVTTQFEAQHHWPEAPDEVAFLRTLHRHVFHVYVEVSIDHSRQLEFIMLKRYIEGVCQRIPNNSTWSCEQMAFFIESSMYYDYDYEWAIIRVSEDGENGSTLHVRKGSSKFDHEKLRRVYEVDALESKMRPI